MIDLLLSLLLWPMYRARNALRLRRFAALSRATTHTGLRAGDEGITLKPGDVMIPWTAIAAASWTSRLIGRFGANDDEDVVVTLRTDDAKTWIVKPTGPDSDEDLQRLVTRGILPAKPDDGGRSAGVGAMFFDFIWILGVSLVALWVVRR